MKLVRSSYEILHFPEDMVQRIEKIASTCYKSERAPIHKLVRMGHTAMIEHGGTISVNFCTNIATTREIIRHRLCSFAEESTRYCNYSKDKFSNEITLIKPHWFTSDNEKDFTDAEKIWVCAMGDMERKYFTLLDEGLKAQDARGTLPLDTKTELVVSANPTQWLHVLKLRTDKAAHPEVRALMKGVQSDFLERCPEIFGGSNNEKDI